MSKQFFQWLDVDSSTVLERWFSTGLAYLAGQGDVKATGLRLAEACLELKGTPEVDKFWTSFPFYTHALNHNHCEDRLNILEQALGLPEFKAWFQDGLDDERKHLLLGAWTLLGEHLNSLDMGWSNRSEKADRPHLGQICTHLWMERYPPTHPEHRARCEQWMRSAPRHPGTRQVVEETIAYHRREALARQVDPATQHHAPRRRVF